MVDKTVGKTGDGVEVEAGDWIRAMADDSIGRVLLVLEGNVADVAWEGEIRGPLDLTHSQLEVYTSRIAAEQARRDDEDEVEEDLELSVEDLAEMNLAKLKEVCEKINDDKDNDDPIEYEDVNSPRVLRERIKEWAAGSVAPRLTDDEDVEVSS